MSVSIVIPTFQREEVLVQTINYLLDLEYQADEIIIVDQTDCHDESTKQQLLDWTNQGIIRLCAVQFPSIPRAMNIGLRKATSERVLFLDDDIIPDKDLVRIHDGYGEKSSNLIVAGRVLQPWHEGKADTSNMPFLFNTIESQEVTSFMGGNFSISKTEAIRIGGFDTNFVRVAYHFEAEFAYRWRKKGGQIFYNAKALIHHLKVSGGGTRTYGNHLKTVKPDHAVGRYYFNFCTNGKINALFKSVRDLISSVVTKHHLKNPLWIFFTLIAEARGLVWAALLYSSGRGLMIGNTLELLVIASHPIQYYSPIYRKLHESSNFNTTILYLSIPDSKSQSLGFGKEFLWDIPLLDGYKYMTAVTETGKGLTKGFFGVSLKKPKYELERIYKKGKPDIVLLTGWHFYGMVQIFILLVMNNIPIMLRMDSNGIKARSIWHQQIYRLFIRFVKLFLIVGQENRLFYKRYGVNDKEMILCPHVVDNDFFRARSDLARNNRDALRNEWLIPSSSFCFLFAGKLQSKKRPHDLLLALKRIYKDFKHVHLLVVGTGELEHECQVFSRENLLPVTFKGFLNQTEIPRAYGISDCIVLPSGDGETWGLVINEAMASGLPAIVSNKVGCGKDLIIPGVTGYIYECGDIDMLCHYLIKLILNPNKSQEMGRNAMNLVNRHFNLEQVISGIETAIKRIHG